MSRICRRSQRGFSLIEMIVAMVILSLSLGMLYQAAAGATRNVRVDERYSYAVLLAQSLLAEHAVSAVGGVNDSGSVADYRWRVSSRLVAASSGSNSDSNSSAEQVPLYSLVVDIAWDDGDNTRQFTLTTVVPEELTGG